MTTEITANTTSQELFDYITTFLLKQGQPSMNKAGDCRYRGPNGKMCAVGCILPDSLYTKDMEGKGIYDIRPTTTSGRIVDEDGAAYFKALTPHFSLLSDLQFVHDQSANRNRSFTVREYWVKNFTEIANRHGLLFRAPL